MSREEGERWIVDLIRDARLDAKIDFKEVGLSPWSSTDSSWMLIRFPPYHRTPSR